MLALPYRWVMQLTVNFANTPYSAKTLKLRVVFVVQGVAKVFLEPPLSRLPSVQDKSHAKVVHFGGGEPVLNSFPSNRPERL